MTTGEWLVSKSTLLGGKAMDVLLAITNTGGGPTIVEGAAPLRYVHVSPGFIRDEEFDSSVEMVEFDCDVIPDGVMDLDIIDGIMSADIEIREEE